MKFHQILKRLRKDKKITQEELAKELEIAPSTVSMYERGEREPNIESIIAIANYFEVTVDFLVGNAIVERKEGGSDGKIQV